MATSRINNVADMTFLLPMDAIHRVGHKQTNQKKSRNGKHGKISLLLCGKIVPR